MALEPVGQLKKLTTLRAVNIILGTIGQRGVQSLAAADTNADVAEALRILNDVSIEEQSEGWSWNTFEGVVLTANNDGEFLVSDDWIKIDTSGCSAWVDVVEMNGKLYDKANNTTVFSPGKQLTVDIVKALPFESLPQSARTYITMSAALRFGTNRTNSNAPRQFSAADLAKARAALWGDNANVDDVIRSKRSPHWQRMRLIGR